MGIHVREAELNEIRALREIYRDDCRCQIVHDSIHERPGWTREFLIGIDRQSAGYGSVAIGGPWSSEPTIFEFFILPPFRTQIFDLFLALQEKCGAKTIETQSNIRQLSMMLHNFATLQPPESVLFEDFEETAISHRELRFRRVEPADIDGLRQNGLDTDGDWLIESEETIVGTGGILDHYNRPYGDLFMEIAAPFRRQGYGAFLVQELKRVCRNSKKIPAARCNVSNIASRKTLQRAGFVPCGHLIKGNIQ